MKFGKYEIIKEIGKGAMGVVYLAFDPVIERQVAIKTMNPQLFQDIEQRERFFREAKSAGILQHPNIVTIYDMGMEGDTPYIVMEYVEGRDLDSLIKSKEIDLDTALKIMAQLCDALGYAHSKGIIHRDIKPSNIRVLPDNTIKIMDFGIAKKSGSDLTQTGVLLGTVSYMAPEQLKEGKVSPQSDQFSAGIVFYEMLSGNKCFQGDTITAVMYKIVSFNEHQIDLKTVPQNIVSILKKMVSHIPENRFQSCLEVSKLLREILSEPTVVMGTGTKTVSVPPPVPQTGDIDATKVGSPEKKQKKRSYAGIIVFFLAIILILTGVVYVAHKKHRKKLALIARKKRQEVTSKEALPVKREKIKLSEQNVEEKPLEEVENMGKSGEPNVEEKVNTEIPVKEKDNPHVQVEEKGNSIEDKSSDDKMEQVIVKKRRERKPPRPLKEKKPEEKEVFSYSNNVKKKEKHLNFIAAQKEVMKRFIKNAEKMPYSEKISKSNALFNAGMRALGNGANRFAAINFYKSIVLNPKRKEAYAFLCVALARMRAYDDIKKIIKKAGEHGISLYDLRENKMFERTYNKLQQQGVFD